MMATDPEQHYPGALLSESDPAPVEVINASGESPFVLTCEHAGRVIPQALGNLGLDAHDSSSVTLRGTSVPTGWREDWPWRSTRRSCCSVIRAW